MHIEILYKVYKYHIISLFIDYAKETHFPAFVFHGIIVQRKTTKSINDFGRLHIQK